MPPISQLLSSLHAITNEAIVIAMLWHAALLVALVAYLRGWRPQRRTAAMLLAAPIASVGVVAFAFGNPFNGLVFCGLAVGLVMIARGMSSGVERGTDWQVLVGHFFIGFGALYPHFLDRSPLAYVIAAPLGTLPCPTLALVLGFTLLAGGFSKAWNLTIVFFAVFYGTIGVMQLGVWIDIVLVLGALALVWLAARLMYPPRYYAR